MQKRFFTTVLSMIMVTVFLSANVYALDYEWQREPDLPVGEFYPGSVVVGNKIYVFGGGDSYYNSLSNKVQIFDTALNTWSLGEPMPENMFAVSCVELDGNIYVIGGYDKRDPKNSLYIYNYTDNSWTAGAAKPTAVGYASSAVIDNKIYAFGGITSSSSNVVEIYDPTDDTWTSADPMPRVRSAFQVFTYNNKVYFIGGSYGLTTPVKAVDIYDIASESWQQGTPHPSPTSHVSGVLVGDKIYSMGGKDSKAIYVYDIQSDSWSKSDIELTSIRSSYAAQVANKKVYVIGGYVGNVASSNNVESMSVADFTGIDDPDPSEENRLYVLLKKGATAQLSLYFDLSKNMEYDWRSTDTSVATVDGDGTVTGLSVGISFIYCSSSDGTYEDYIPVKVIDDEDDERLLALHLTVGSSQMVWLDDEPGSVTWTSDNSAIAEIDSVGLITARSKGVCVITGDKDGVKHYINVRVNN